MRTRGAIGLASVLGLSLAAAGCGGAVCGDGKPEGSEQCDDGNSRDDDACSNSCKAQDTRDAQVIWTMLAHELEGFNESCTGVAAAKIKLVVTGPDPIMSPTLDLECNSGQYRLMALDPGDYSVQATLFDAAGTALTKGKAHTEFTIPEGPAGAPVQTVVDFPFDDFVREYTGNWLYKITWAGATSCAAATPPVVKRTIRLERDGVALKNASGVPIDGTAAESCENPSSVPQIQNLPWGAADLIVTGFDATDTPQFHETFPTFVGAGILNPILTYDVDSLAPDAGVPDAAPPDAAAPDAS